MSRPRLSLLAVLTLSAALLANACAQDAAGREATARASTGQDATGREAASDATAGRATAGRATGRDTAAPTTPSAEGAATTPSGAADNGVEAKASVPAPPAVLAEAKDPDAPVVVQVVDARRATADTVRVRLAFISKAPEGQTVPPFADGTDPADFCLFTADGARRLFLLRDAQNQPVLDGSLQPLRPGERRIVDAMFPAPPAPSGESARVTLRLGKLTLRNIPIVK